jgi:signal transduction histidine kinase
VDLTEIIPAFEALVFERLPNGRFLARSVPPPWCRQVRPDVRWDEPLALDEVFPFLTVFLPQAEDQSWAPGGHPIRSDIWQETENIHVRAAAVRLGEAAALIIVRSDPLYHERQDLLQRARELRMMHTSLMREIEQKDILIHAIVHDLAAPLHSILGVLSLLDERPRDEPEASWVRLGIQAAVRQRELIGEILDVFAAEGDTLGAASVVALQEIIDEVVAEREPVARTRSLSLERIVREPEPRVVADRVRLFRVLTNLLDNAIRNSPSGGVVRISTRREDDSVMVFVEDDGPGVPASVLPHLFEKFARGRDRSSGTGLGLFFCRITVENWGGGIGYERRRTGGARFWIRLKTSCQVERSVA